MRIKQIQERVIEPAQQSVQEQGRQWSVNKMSKYFTVSLLREDDTAFPIIQCDGVPCVVAVPGAVSAPPVTCLEYVEGPKTCSSNNKQTLSLPLTVDIRRWLGGGAGSLGCRWFLSLLLLHHIQLRDQRLPVTRLTSPHSLVTTVKGRGKVRSCCYSARC